MLTCSTGTFQVLEEATAKKSAQDKARAEAQRLCDEGDRLLAGFDGRIRWADSIEKSIVQYKLGLELADKVNGTHGWKSCMKKLKEKNRCGIIDSRDQGLVGH